MLIRLINIKNHHCPEKNWELNPVCQKNRSTSKLHSLNSDFIPGLLKVLPLPGLNPIKELLPPVIVNKIALGNKLAYFILFAFFISFLLKLDVQAQDIHFSQFYATPLLTNPANTGMSDGDLRIANNYRNQWSKIDVAYKTLYISIDKKLILSKHLIGIGGVILHDQSSVFNLSADEFLLSLSYSKIIHNQQFAIGLQPGFILKSYNLNGLTFGSQFDASNQKFSSNLPSMEDGLTDNLHHFDMNIGIYWRTLIHNLIPSAGLSIRHILRPVETFSTSSSGSRLPMKLSINGQVIIPLSSKIDVTPNILYGFTTGVNELVAGGIESYAINDFNIQVKKVYTITMLRVNPFRNIDALILGIGVNFLKFNLGFTYDMNISPLSNATNFNGAFEISLIYNGISHTLGNINEPCHIY
jgi:type IX secretion system PorP/SprF family membrane protein